MYCQSWQTHAVKEVEMHEYTALMEATDIAGKIQCTVEVQVAKTIEAVTSTVDTGASVSVLPRCIYEELFKKAPLRQSFAQMVT